VTESRRTGQLMEFASVSTGPFGSLLHKSDYVSDGVPLVNPINIVGERIVPDPEKLIDGTTVERLASYILREGDIVISRRGELGRCAAIGPNESGWVCGTGCFFIRPGNVIEPRFLAAMLRSDVYRKKLEGASTGATMPSISNATLSNLSIAVPARDEQQRIVAILDEAFAGIATAKANAEMNLQNGREVFEGCLESKFASNSADYLQAAIGEVTGGVFTGPFGSLLHKRDYVDNGIPLINPAHISAGEIFPDTRKTVSAETATRLSSYVMNAGDIVIGRRGEMGRCAVVTESQAGWLCGTGSFVIRAGDTFNSDYLSRLLRSDVHRKRLEKIAGGAVMPNLSNSDLSGYQVALPPLVRQIEMLREIELMEAEFKRLESIYTRKLTALDELKQSLLHQAFSGQL
jgi:type I restriction enzyme S subunit